MKLRELKRIEPSLSKLLESNELPVSSGFRLRPVTRKVIRFFTDLEESRLSLVNKYGESYIDAQGNEGTRVKKEFLEDFNKEYNSLLDEEIDLIVSNKLKIADLDGKVKLTALDIENLGFLFEDE